MYISPFSRPNFVFVEHEQISIVKKNHISQLKTLLRLRDNFFVFCELGLVIWSWEYGWPSPKNYLNQWCSSFKLGQVLKEHQE